MWINKQKHRRRYPDVLYCEHIGSSNLKKIIHACHKAPQKADKYMEAKVAKQFTRFRLALRMQNSGFQIQLLSKGRDASSFNSCQEHFTVKEHHVIMREKNCTFRSIRWGLISKNNEDTFLMF
jgi:hypothetical protein